LPKHWLPRSVRQKSSERRLGLVYPLTDVDSFAGKSPFFETR
jgi:hypothetical protein